MAHREGIREFLKDVKLTGTVIDWGCGTKPIKNYLKGDYKYIGIDKLERVGADYTVDIETSLVLALNYPFDGAQQADFAFCLEVIEHTWNAHQLLLNIWNFLKPSGVLYLSQPFMYEVHKEDDRVRYTHHGLRQLLEEAMFKDIQIEATVGDLDHAEGYIVRAVK